MNPEGFNNSFGVDEYGIELSERYADLTNSEDFGEILKKLQNTVATNKAARKYLPNVTASSANPPAPVSSPSVAKVPTEADDLRTQIVRALAIHTSVDDPRPGKDAYCAHCSSEYPCVTVQALTDPI